MGNGRADTYSKIKVGPSFTKQRTITAGIAVAAVEVDPATVGQYTGRKDKNGKDVYEADILTDKFGSMGVVEWRDSGFVVNFGDTDIFDLSGCFGDSYQMWVVGNIHDNADLIKIDEI